jgi:trehalose/maltose hydrolase-like predicted phosphorylase
MKKNDRFFTIQENVYQHDHVKVNETLYSLANGFIGLRGNHDEANIDDSISGTYLNSFHEKHQIYYGEKLFGFPEEGQTMLNVTDAKIIRIEVDNELFSLQESRFEEYRRVLNMKTGVLYRTVLWTTASNQKLRIESWRIVSFVNKHLCAINYRVTPVECNSDITIYSLINADVKNLDSEDDPRIGSVFGGQVLYPFQKEFNDSSVLMVQKSSLSEKIIGTYVKNSIQRGTMIDQSEIDEETIVGIKYIFSPDRPIELNKFIGYDFGLIETYHNVYDNLTEAVDYADKVGFDKLVDGQKDFLGEFWETTDIQIEGDDLMSQGVRFNLFHLLQSTGRDGMTNIAAKGLTGEGYDGHYFWDTETYIFPLFLFSNPSIAKNLLIFRYNTLEEARKRALEMNHAKGALFPWRTIDGSECSAYFPAGTAQYHINADIALAVTRYFEATGDWDFMCDYGVELLIETARIWADFGSFIPERDGAFCINGVTGPDEYTCLINNNTYTNYMAAKNFKEASRAVKKLIEKDSEVFDKLSKNLDFDIKETVLWDEAAEKMFYPYDEDRGLYAQDDSFLMKPVWDFENTPKENYPLLLNYHPLVLYRYQVCKQADLLLAEFLLSDQFTKEQKRRDFDYYKTITTHDSSLSTCIFSIIAAEIGETEQAYEFFYDTVRTDLDNKKGNTEYGIHSANMAGTWSAIVFGFGGVRVNNGIMSIDPVLPQKLNGFSFNIVFKGSHIRINVTDKKVTCSLVSGEPMKLKLQGKDFTAE